MTARVWSIPGPMAPPIDQTGLAGAGVGVAWLAAFFTVMAAATFES